MKKSGWFVLLLVVVGASVVGLAGFAIADVIFRRRRLLVGGYKFRIVEEVSRLGKCAKCSQGTNFFVKIDNPVLSGVLGHPSLASCRVHSEAVAVEMISICKLSVKIEGIEEIESEVAWF